MITLSSTDGQAVVFRETVPVWRVAVRLHKYAEQSSTTSLYTDSPVSFDAVRRQATVSSAPAGGAIMQDSMCQIVLKVAHLAHTEARCHLQLTCAKKSVYDGYARCALDGDSGKPWLFRDDSLATEDGDPRVELDLRAMTGTFDDGQPVQLAIDGG